MMNVAYQPGTIVALATPYGTGAIALIRLSGNEAFHILKKIFHPKNKVFSPDKIRSHSLIFGEIYDGDTPLDEVLVGIFKSPHSYTGEDVVEISCHASPYIQTRLIQLLIEKGARQAQAGEFSLRAFLNAKMDLSRTEAVADLINARNETARKLAYNQLKGNISKDLSELRKQLLHFASLIELELDFSEEDVEFADRRELEALLQQLLDKTKSLAGSFRLGNALKNGILSVIAGKPNAGKSTLLNALVKDNRAIVTDIPGTTRDSLEEVIHWKGMEFRLVDTAGLRETIDTVESIGVEKAKEYVQKANIIIYLLEANKSGIDEIKDEIHALPRDIPKLIIANKSDVTSPDKLRQIEATVLSTYEKTEYLSLSAQNDSHPEDFIFPAVIRLLELDNFKSDSTIITNTRHYEALQAAIPALEKVMEGLESGLTGDLLSIEIREALYHIGSITGEITTDDLLGNIFSKFCIGK
jgi:tRNA modification GTPase